MKTIVRVLPVLLVHCLHWTVSVTMLIAALLAVVSDSTGVPISASAGAAAVFVLCVALAANLKRLNAGPLARLLPGFRTRTWLATGLIVLVGCLLAALPSFFQALTWTAIVAGASAGLGLGLIFGIRYQGLVLVVPMMTVIIIDADLHRLFTSPWSLPAGMTILAAAMLLAIRFPDFLRSSSRCQSGLQGQLNLLARQPHRPGRLFSATTSLGFLLTGWLAGIVLGVWGHDGSLRSPLSPLHQSQLASYVWLFALMAVAHLVSTHVFNIGSALRPLAVLPGWNRERLWRHLETSTWRICAIILLVLLLSLASIATLSEQQAWPVLTRPVLLTLGFCLIMVPLGLWIASFEHAIDRVAGYLFTMVPALIGLGYLHGMDFDRVELPGTLAMLFGLLALAWWLRRRARAAWLTCRLVRG